MDEMLTTIKEVQEGGKNFINWYLSQGYILLAIQPGARAATFPQPNPNGQQQYVRRNPVYVAGRPDGVEPAPPWPGVERSRAGSKSGREAAESKEK